MPLIFLVIVLAIILGVVPMDPTMRQILLVIDIVMLAMWVFGYYGHGYFR